MDEQIKSDEIATELELTPEPFNSVSITISSSGNIGRVMADVIEALKGISFK